MNGIGWLLGLAWPCDSSEEPTCHAGAAAAAAWLKKAAAAGANRGPGFCDTTDNLTTSSRFLSTRVSKLLFSECERGEADYFSSIGFPLPPASTSQCLPNFCYRNKICAIFRLTCDCEISDNFSNLPYHTTSGGILLLLT